MRLGISEVATTVGGRDGRWIVGAATAIEAAGFDSLWIPERIVAMPVHQEEHPYGSQREIDALRQDGLFDNLTCLGAIAAVTRRVRIGTYVHLVGLRHPILTARAVATLDQLSEGRFDFGVGVGWLREEHEALGVPWQGRGRRVTESLRAIRELWSNNPAAFQGQDLEIPLVHVGPRPAQRPAPPILIGGNSEATVRRIVEVGDGWLGFGLPPEAIRDFIARVREALNRAGRDPASVRLAMGYRPAGAVAGLRRDQLDKQGWREAREFMETCAELGIDEFVVSARLPVDGFDEHLLEFASVMGVSPRHSSVGAPGTL